VQNFCNSYDRVTDIIKDYSKAMLDVNIYLKLIRPLGYESMIKLNLCHLVIILIIICTGCTSTPQATQYPERYIDQQYTLPSKVDVWGLIGITMYQTKYKSTSESFLPPIPVPLYWEHSLNENLTLEIPVLPLGLRWRIKSDEDSELGMHLGYGIVYSTATGTNLRPTASLYYKKFKDKDHAYIFIPSIEYSYYADKTEHSYLNGAMTLGYLTQLNDKNVIEPGITVGFSGYNNRIYFPLHLFYTYRLTQVWQFESRYTYSHLGYEDYLSHSVNFIFKKFF
jgi:hypothetical protein